MDKEIIQFGKTYLPIKIQKINMRKNIAYRGIHSHSAIEIVLVKKGLLDCYVNNEKISITPKQIIFINSNIQHKLSSGNADIVYINLDISRYSEKGYYDEFSALYDFILRSKSMPYMVLSDNIEINSILEKTIEEYNGTQEASNFYLKSYIYWLMAFMYSKSFITPIASSTFKIEKIKSAVRYINENFRANITLDDICRVAKYNKYAVCHAFKSITGSTIFEYINFLRIHYAIEKFERDNSTILEVATESGFSSVTYFDKTFKSIVGCSPSVYRKHFLML